MQVPFLDRLQLFEELIVQGDPVSIAAEYKILKNSFGGTSCISGAIRLCSEKCPEAVSFHPRLLQVHGLKKMLTLQERVCVALFIHKIVHGVVRTTDQYFKKDYSFRWPLPWSLQYVAGDQSTYAVEEAFKYSLGSSGIRKEIIRFSEDCSIVPTVIDTRVSFPKLFFEQPEKFPEQAVLNERILQCRSIDPCACGLEAESVALLMLFIEMAIHRNEKSENCYFKKKSTFQPVPLIRSLQYIAEAKATYVLIKTHRNTLLHKRSTEKKVTAAIEIPDDKALPSRIVAQAVNIDKELFKYVVAESQIHKKFSGNKGIWPLLSCAEYQRGSFSQDPKVSLFTPMGRSAREIFKKKIILTIAQHIEMADQIISGVHLLHSFGYLNGDLKYKNVLFQILSNTEITTGLIDFGHSFIVDNGIPDWSLLPNGYYGSVYPTAPELFGVQNFAGDLFKVEIWALGILLYELFYQKKPDWTSIIISQWQWWKERPVEQWVGTRLKETAKKSTDSSREQLLAKPNRSVEDDYLLLIYDMLQFEQEKRLDSGACMQRIAQLKERLLAEQIGMMSIGN